MKLAVLHWFGWSILWLLPLVWRVLKAKISGKKPLGGQGTIRFFLGSVVMVCASSALEASIRANATTTVIGGKAIAALFAAPLGKFIGVLALLMIIALVLPWLFGAGPAKTFEIARRLFGGKAEQARRRRVSEPPLEPSLPQGGGRRAPAWDISATRAMPEAIPKHKAALGPKPAPVATSAGSRKMDQWAPVERIIPTSAMRSARHTQAPGPLQVQEQMQAGSDSRLAQLRKAQQARRTLGDRQLGDSQLVQQVHRTQTSTFSILQTSADGRAAMLVESVTDVTNVTNVTNSASLVQSHLQGTPEAVSGAMPASAQFGSFVPFSAPMAEDVNFRIVPLNESLAIEVAPSSVSANVPVNSPSNNFSTASADSAPPALHSDWRLDPLPPISQTTQAAPTQQSALPPTHSTQLAPDASAAATISQPWKPWLAVEDIDGGTVPDADDHAATGFKAPQPPAGAARDEFEFHPLREVNIDLPGLDLLDTAVAAAIPISPEWMDDTAQLIEQRLREFKVPVTVIGANAGPVITRFEVEPALGVRGSQIVGLMKDLSRALGMTSIRVVETIPGKTCMGLELPNTQRQMIRLSEILESDAYRNSTSHLTLAMGKDITGNPLVADLARAPHMLVAGTTGSGKSVAINAMILSLLYKATPADVRLIMIDPKMLELSVYEGIPHLLAPVVTDMKLAANALGWCVTEMDKRYRLMSALGVRNLAGFNQKIQDGIRRERKVTNPFSLTPDAPEPLSTLPMIVVIIDELADLMMVAGKKIEELIARLAQKARAAGIHLILATQRPSVDVITGLIKANIPTRVAFQVSSKIDSRTILDQMGAEALLGHGDMLFLPPGSGYPQRVHGAFVSDEEVHRVVEFLKQFGEPEYEEAILAGVPSEAAEKDLLGDAPDVEADPLYDEAVAYVVRSRRASISSVQRQLRVGYNRAARLVEQMEAAGILSSMATNGSRDVLAPPMME